jgi:hypothetical protein
MDYSIFLQIEFFLLVTFSIVVPAGLFWLMLAKRTISRAAVLVLGLVLIGIAAIDVTLLRLLATKAARTGELLHHNVFASEVSLGLYLLPALFAGIGINLVSHVLVHHLSDAERRFEENRPPR